MKKIFKIIFKIIRFLIALIPYFLGGVLTITGVGLLGLKGTLFIIISMPFLGLGIGLIELAEIINY